MPGTNQLARVLIHLVRELGGVVRFPYSALGEIGDGKGILFEDDPVQECWVLREIDMPGNTVPFGLEDRMRYIVSHMGEVEEHHG